MSACGPLCGGCGRCTDAWERPDDPDPIPVCDRCGKTCPYTLSLAGVGMACSRACLDILARQHARAMEKQHA